jgi:hypothetical protein
MYLIGVAVQSFDPTNQALLHSNITPLKNLPCHLSYEPKAEACFEPRLISS